MSTVTTAGPNIGTIKLNSGGTYGEFFPKTIYEAITPSVGSETNLGTELDSIKGTQSTMKSKLDGIAAGANNYTHPTTSGNKHIPSGGKSGQILRWGADGTAVWGEDQNTTYSEATTSQSGLMSTSDKTKLDGISEGANNYVHPTTSGNKHIPSGGSVGQVLRWGADGTAVWGADNDTTYSEATITNSGLMSSADKTKLDGIAAGANKYTHPDNANTRHVTDTQIELWTAKETTTGAQAKADAALVSANLYTDNKVAALVGSAPATLDTLEELAKALNDNESFATTVAENIGKKVDKVEGMGLSEANFTTLEKTKLAAVEANANYYVHPTTTGNKHIPSGGTSGQILRWSASGTAIWSAETDTTYDVVSKSAPGLVPQLPNETTTTKYLRQDGQWVVPPNMEYSEATTSASGLMSASDKTKLNGIATGANNYTHPTTTGNKHIPSGGSTGQILRWSADGTAVWSAENNTTYSAATTTTDGLMSSADKTKLDGIAAGANNYTHPTSSGSKHIPSGGTTGQILRWSADGTATWSNENNTTYSVASTTANGLMSSTDKAKLDGIATGANNYTHPTTSGNKHIPTGGTTGQILRWSADGTAVWGAENNTTYSAATTSTDGLMSSTDKSKLDGIATGANNYTHPTTSGNKHIPSGGVAGQILKWSADGTAVWAAETNTTYSVATSTSNGLMSSTDKAKLDAATNAATASTIVMRDASGNFSAGTITAALSGNASTATKWATARTITVSGGVTGSVSLDGSGNVTLATTLSNLASNKVTAMTGYSVATTASAIAATDSLNTAIGKLEKALKDATAQNEELRSILAMFAIMNGCAITTSATVTEIKTAITELYTNRGTSQFIYGAIIE